MPTHWYRYVDDTFFISQQHGKQTLKDFFQRLSGIRGNIKFTMELEQSGIFPFLDVLAKKKRMAHLATLHTGKLHTQNDILLADSEH